MGWADDSKRGFGSSVFTSRRAPTNRPKYGWQQKSGGGPPRIFSHWWGIYAAVTCGLVAVFVAAILLNTPPTPLMVVAGVGYDSPTPPNVWAQEDADGLLDLTDTFAAKLATGDSVGEESEARVQVEQWLSSQSTSGSIVPHVPTPVMLYFRMPGLVDGAGRPCLLPPGASPLGDSRLWWSIESILTLLKEKLPESRSKLLVLDCDQHPICWRMGIAYNTFHERLQDRLREVATKGEIKNLAVITSAGPGERAWTAPELGGSAFGTFLQLGLAGDADRKSGDPDGKVSLKELAAYLGAEVDGWAGFHRAQSQRPRLIASDQLDFTVAVAKNRRVDEIYDRLKAAASAKPSVPNAKIVDLWKQLEGLAPESLAYYAPRRLAKLQRRLLTLEQLAIGGEGCSVRARNEAEDLAVELSRMRSQQKPGSPALADAWGVSDPDQAAAVRLKGLHSLPLREFFADADGAKARAESKRVQAMWQRLAQAAPQTGFAAAGPPVVSSDVDLETTQFLAAANLQQAAGRGKPAGGVMTLLRLRSIAEALAVPRAAEGAPGDARAHYYVRSSLAEPDRLRRQAEDLLFVEQAGLDAGESADRAETAYKRANQVRRNVAFAFEVVDRATAELPYLAEWACLPAVTQAKPLEGGSPAELAAFARATLGLASTLSAVPVGDAASAAPSDRTLWSRAQAEVEEPHTRLRDQFRRAYKDLGSANSGQEVAAILAALTSPLVHVEDDQAEGAAEGGRRNLLKRRDDISATLHEMYFGGDSKPAGSSGSSAAAKTIAGWADHPLLALLDTTAEPDQADQTKTLERIGAAAKQRLAEAAAGRPVAGDSPPAADAPGGVFAADRKRLAGAALLARRAAPLGIWPAGLSPVADLRRFDLQQLLLWHARRAAEGFWHTVTGPSPTTIDQLLNTTLQPINDQERLYFRKAALSYVGHAQRLRPSPSAGVSDQINAVRELVEQRELASLHGVLLEPLPKPIVDGVDGEAKRFRLEVVAKPNAKGPNLPAGTMALYVLDSRGARAAVSEAGEGWGSLPLPLASASRRLSASFVGGADLEAKAAGFFRGQVYLNAFSVPNPRVAEISYKPPTYDGQSVRLVGDAAGPAAVVFILDCSESMKASILATDDADTKDTRLKLAVQQLRTMLEDLSRVDASQVGLIFFGHRLQWKNAYRGDPVEEFIRVNPLALRGKRPQRVTPAEDWEWICRIGRFDETQLGIANDRFAGIKPFGLTPVYLSIIEALKGLSNIDETYAKSVIVITDGKNEQSYPRGLNAKAPATAQQVLSEFARVGGKTPVHVLGFGIEDEPDADGSIKRAIKEFDLISATTGGDSLQVNSGADLLRKIRERLDLRGYSVVGPDNRAVTVNLYGEADKVSLGQETSIPNGRYPLPADIKLVYEAAGAKLETVVTLEGGEAIKVRAPSRPGEGFRPVLVEPGFSRDTLLQRGREGSRTSHRLRVFPPKLSRAGAARFRLVLQDEQAPYTRRPSVVWVEVTPVSRERSAAVTYVFSDRVFKPGTVAPVVEFDVGNWPTDALSARVRFWCSFDPPAVAGVIPLDGAVSAPTKGARVSPDSTVAVSLDAKRGDATYTVTVTEKHTGDPPELNALRVWLEDVGRGEGQPPLTPAKVSHLFEATESVVRRSYEFAPAGLSPSDFARRIEVRVGLGEDFKADALQMPSRGGMVVGVVPEAAHRANQLGE